MGAVCVSTQFDRERAIAANRIRHGRASHATADRGASRANRPGIFHCPRCGERLSGPAWKYEPCRVPLVTS
jgi:ribosomal protein L37AE/L43A